MVPRFWSVSLHLCSKWRPTNFKFFQKMTLKSVFLYPFLTCVMIFEDWGSPVGELVSTWLSELLELLEDWLIPGPVPGCPPPPITWTGTVFRPTKGLLLAEGIFSIKWLGNLKDKPKCSGLECLNFQSCEKELTAISDAERTLWNDSWLIAYQIRMSLEDAI